MVCSDACPIRRVPYTRFFLSLFSCVTVPHDALNKPARENVKWNSTYCTFAVPIPLLNHSRVSWIAHPMDFSIPYFFVALSLGSHPSGGNQSYLDLCHTFNGRSHVRSLSQINSRQSCLVLIALPHLSRFCVCCTRVGRLSTISCPSG
jgi:hypothetical protein